MSGLWRVDSATPVRGKHYPATQPMFEDWFASEEQARAYVAAVRWRNGVGCPLCGSVELVLGGPRGWWCKDCHHHVSLTAGTLMQGTRLSMRLWLAACWHMTQSKPGISATSFAAMYGMTYNTAWVLLHKIRRAMDQAGREKLSGLIEIDESWYGGVEPGRKGGKGGKKQVVIVACEVGSMGSSLGRVRLKRVHDASTVSITAFIEEYIEPGSVLFSDGAWPYVNAANDLYARGLVYKLDQTVMKGNPAPTASLLPHVHLVISLSKRWLLGTFQGAAMGQHLGAYLDEYTFRFNRRKSRNRGLLFYRLVCALTEVAEPVRYDELRDRKAVQKNDLKTHRVATDADKSRRKDEANLRGNRVAREKYAAEKAGLPFDPPTNAGPVLHPDLVHIAPVEPF